MRCLSPRTVGFLSDGKTISWSPKNYCKDYATFQLPCSKCIECRLEYARQWAVRCVHESHMHENNCFVTLTYDDAHLTSPQLNYADFQEFMRKLRQNVFRTTLRLLGIKEAIWNEMTLKERQPTLNVLKTQEIPFAVVGEYGEKNKRPHWHALIFNWKPLDSIYKYTTEKGHRVYHSKALSALWGMGTTEYGSITTESAGYVMRYSAKKLVHGHDDDHLYHPISKKSSKHAIGKSFLQKHYKQIFEKGFVVTESGAKCAIPRYYEKWMEKNHPDLYSTYVTQIKNHIIYKAASRESQHKVRTMEANHKRLDLQKPLLVTKNEQRKIIIEDRFKRLQTFLKGDI